MSDRTEAPIDAGRCICGEWVSTPHRECIALVDEHANRSIDREDSDHE